MVCPEATSTPAHAGSKVMYEIGIGEETILCVEATPNFYARRLSEYAYLLIGECESSGSKDPSVQLAIATLGQFASKRFKHPVKTLAACLFTKAKTASIFLGEELERRGEKFFISFSKQWRIQGGKGGASVPPFGLHPTLRSTDDKLKGTPLSGYRTKKTAAMAHLRMLQKKICSKTDRLDW